MAGVVVTVTAMLPVGPDSWLLSDQDLAEMTDAELLSFIRTEMGVDVLEDATWSVERVP